MRDQEVSVEEISPTWATWEGDFIANTVDLVENITRVQADPNDSIASNFLSQQQRGISKGLIDYSTATKLFTRAYQLCVEHAKILPVRRSAAF